MLNKKEKTMERYMKVGAEMRLLKTIGAKAATDMSLVLSAKDTDKLLKALRMIEEVSSKAEDNMFADFPELSNEYIDVFFGSTDDRPRNEVDRKIIEMARETADELFERKNN